MRLAVVTTALFAFGDAIGNGQIALFGAFGSIAILIFAPFGGPPASGSAPISCSPSPASSW